MKRQLKKAAVLALSAAMVMGMSGCGKKEEPAASATTASAAEETKTEAAAGETAAGVEKAAEVITILTPPTVLEPIYRQIPKRL